MPFSNFRPFLSAEDGEESQLQILDVVDALRQNHEACIKQLKESK